MIRQIVKAAGAKPWTVRLTIVGFMTFSVLVGNFLGQFDRIRPWFPAFFWEVALASDGARAYAEELIAERAAATDPQLLALSIQGYETQQTLLESTLFMLRQRAAANPTDALLAEQLRMYERRLANVEVNLQAAQCEQARMNGWSLPGC